MGTFLEETNVADYFLMAGWKDTTNITAENNQASDYTKPNAITSIIVTYKPENYQDYKILTKTACGHQINANIFFQGRKTPYVGFKCGNEGMNPVIDIQIVEVGKTIPRDFEIIETTSDGEDASLTGIADNDSLYLVMKRGRIASKYALVDLCLIRTDKNERCPHTYNLANRSIYRKLFGPEIYLAYRRSKIRSPLCVSDGEILFRYPVNDYQKFPLPPTIPSFCLPQQAVIDYCFEKKYPLPQFFTFSLTNIEGAMVYGASLIISELLPEEKQSEYIKSLVSELQKMSEKEIYIYHNKCICIVSKQPFFDFFHKYLLFLYRITLSGPQVVPIERYVVYLMRSVPRPTYQRPVISVLLFGSESIVLTLPPFFRILPHSGASFPLLLRILSIDGITKILHGLLTEKFILVHSSSLGVITGVVEAISQMIYPIQWQSTYVPYCPLSLRDIISAPFPCICGVDSSYFDDNPVPNEVLLVDLNTGTVEIIEQDSKFTSASDDLPEIKSVTKMVSKLTAIQSKIDEILDANSINLNPSSYFSSLSNVMMLKIHMEIQLSFCEYIFDLTKSLFDQTQSQESNKKGFQATYDIINAFGIPSFIVTSPFKTSNQKTFYKIFSQTQLFTNFQKSRSHQQIIDHFTCVIEDCKTVISSLNCHDIDDISDTTDRVDNRITVSVSLVSPQSEDDETSKYNYDSFPILDHNIIIKEENLIRDHSSFHGNKDYYMIFLRTSTELKYWNEKASHYDHLLKADLYFSQILASWFVCCPSLSSFLQKSTIEPAIWSAFFLNYMLHKLYSVIKVNKELVQNEVYFRIILRFCLEFQNKIFARKLVSLLKALDFTLDFQSLQIYNELVEKSYTDNPSISACRQKWNVITAAMIARNIFERIATSSSEMISSSSTGKTGLTSHINNRHSSSSLLSGYLVCGMGLFKGVNSDNLLYEMSSFILHSSLKNELIMLEDHIPLDHHNIVSRTADLFSISDVDSHLINGEKQKKSVNEPIHGYLEVSITSCQPCPACFTILYDELILYGWKFNGFNSQTCCCYCSSKFSPDLRIKIKVFKEKSLKENSNDAELETLSALMMINNRLSSAGTAFSSASMMTNNFDKSSLENHQFPMDSSSLKGEELSDFSVNFMCPWTIRHEIEAMFEVNGGDAFLCQTLPASKPSLFWNLIWYFNRLNLVSQLTSLLIPLYNLTLDSKVRIISSWEVDAVNIQRNRPSYHLFWTPSYEISFEYCDKFVRRKLDIIHNLYHENKMLEAIQLLSSIKKKGTVKNCLKWGIYYEYMWILMLYDGEAFDFENYDDKFRSTLDIYFHHQTTFLSNQYHELFPDPCDLPPPKEALAFRKSLGMLRIPLTSSLLRNKSFSM